MTSDGGFGSCAAESIALIYAYIYIYTIIHTNIYIYISTFWLFNKAMDNDAFVDDNPDDLPLKMVILAMLNNQWVPDDIYLPGSRCQTVAVLYLVLALSTSFFFHPVCPESRN